MSYLQKVKACLKRIPLLYDALRKIRNLVFPKPTLQDRMMRVLGGKRSVFFIQVGANDGIKADPIHDLIVEHRHWQGIFIEPVGFLFHRLKRNYEFSDRFIFENIAVGTKKETKAFYYLPETAADHPGIDLPFYFDQLGSFDKDHIFKHFGGEVEPLIVEEEVECLSLREILDRNLVTALDLLHIDTEGFDYKILSQVDFMRYKPSAILFEHKHLGFEEAQRATSLLETSGYRLFRYGADTLAIRRDTDRFWRRKR